VFVTPDELAPYRDGTSYDLGMTATVNGNVLGHDRWNNMAYSYGEMIAYASRGTHIRPGDVFGSGTCGGGCLAEAWGRHGRQTPPPLQAGDTVTISVDELGVLTSRLTAGVDPIRMPSRRQPPNRRNAGATDPSALIPVHSGDHRSSSSSD
jgi:2-keto-4-pentenoate hydratase/2-oxohepta-3-ene-1,7-dioic acid hydratase in catechol pathway